MNGARARRFERPKKTPPAASSPSVGSAATIDRVSF